MRVLVVGATGYIGKFVVKELLRRGYSVTAFARPKSGIKGKSTQEDVAKVIIDKSGSLILAGSIVVKSDVIAAVDGRSWKEQLSALEM